MNTSSGRVAVQNHSIGGPSQSTACSGLTRVRFFGTISPNTVCANTTAISARTNATGSAADTGRRTASRTRASRWASAGSAIAPRPNEQTVTPSCDPAIIRGICSIARTASRARLLPAAKGSTMVRRAATTANSPPTKNALPSNRTRTTSSLAMAGLLGQDDPYLLDPAPLDIDHGELPAVLLDRLALDRDVSEPGHDESGQRLVRAVRQPEPGRLRQLVRAYHALDQHPGRGRRQRYGHLVRGRLQVVLVGDLPDQLLGEVLQGHQTVGAAVLVHHDGQLRVGRLQRLQYAVEVQALRHVHRLPGDHRHRLGAPPGRGYAERGDHGGHPGDQVHGGLVDREAAVPGVPRGRQQLAEGGRRR